MTCLVSYTLSWLTSSQKYDLGSVQFASYTIENEKIDEEKIGDLVKYTIQLTAKGDAETGYCKIIIKDEEYYTEPIEPEDSLTFSLIVSKEDYKKIEYSAQWGIYEGEADIEEGAMINEKGEIVQDEEYDEEATTEVETESESEDETESETEDENEDETETEEITTEAESESTEETETESETETSQTEENSQEEE
jgi:hypothetical protein